jgi:ribonucleoside-diphosphate reductase alpha chain
MHIVNQTVPRALKALGYTKPQIDAIVAYIDVEKSILGAPALKKEHENVFACSMGDNSIHYLGHVKMMAAVQPFLSGAISKTVNMPEEATIEDIEQIHIDSWKMGLKAVAIYRDNCKVGQPLSMAKKEGSEKTEPAALRAAETEDKFVLKGAVRRKLPRVRNSKTYKFHIADLEGYFTVGEYEDGTPGEIFINVSKQGSTLSGLMDSFAISVSLGLQNGVPLKAYASLLRGASFAPAGITNDPDVRTASSITDYIVRRMAMDYLSFDDRLELGLASLDDMPTSQTTLIEPAAVAPAPEPTPAPAPEPVAVSEAPAMVTEEAKATVGDSTAPLCYNCGNQTQRAGSCYVCSSCGSTTGCS